MIEKMSYILIPLKRKQAQNFINEFHRHHKAPIADIFRIGLVCNKKLIGCTMVGRPVARGLDNGLTLEVNRCCVKDGYKNACSMLYGAAARVAKNLGYSKIVTYTLNFESGASLRAVGWKLESSVKGRNWHTPSREREQKSEYQTCDKYRWGKTFHDHEINLSKLLSFDDKEKDQQQLRLF